MESESLKLAREYLGKMVTVTMDRPMGTKHPKHNFIYEVNYGYVENTKAPDGEELDAYFLGVEEPLETAEGVCVAVIHRQDNDDDKLIVVPNGTNLTDEEIMVLVHFQEQWFKSEVVREWFQHRP